MRSLPISVDLDHAAIDLDQQARHVASSCLGELRRVEARLELGGLRRRASAIWLSMLARSASSLATTPSRLRHDRRHWRPRPRRARLGAAVARRRVGEQILEARDLAAKSRASTASARLISTSASAEVVGRRHDRHRAGGRRRRADAAPDARIDVGDQALEEEVGVVREQDRDGDRLADQRRVGDDRSRSSSAPLELIRPFSACRARRSSATSGNCLSSAARIGAMKSPRAITSVAGPVGIDRLRGRRRRRASRCRGEGRQRLDDDVGDQEDEEAKANRIAAMP